LNPLAGLSSLGLGTDLTQATLLNQLYQNNTALLLERANDQLPLTDIQLNYLKHKFAFADRDSERNVRLQELQLGLLDQSEQRKLLLASRTNDRDFDLQKQQLQLLSKKDDRGFWGNIIASVAPALLGFFAKNQEGSREERMFKWAHEQRDKDDDGDEKLKKRIAKLERLLKAKNDDGEDTCSTVKKKKKTKTCKHHHDNSKNGTIVTRDDNGDSRWVVVRKKKVDDDQIA
jgi:hypothetical protein